MLNIKTILADTKDNRLYLCRFNIKDVDGRTLRNCKTCTPTEFLMELLEYKDDEIISILKNAKFERM